MKLTILIAEDERLAREELAYMLAKEPDIELLEAAASGTAALALAAKHKPDVVFMDIEMPEMDGIQAAQRLAADADTEMPLLVFTTAYDRHAIEAFRLGAVDYLLKPYGEERLGQTLARIRSRAALRRAERQAAASGAGMTKPVASFTPPKRDKLLIEDGSRMVVIEARQCLYAVKEEKSTRLHLADGRTFVTKQTLQELEERLGAGFFRPHRSYLINLDGIEAIEPWFNGAYNALLKGPGRTCIPVSRVAAKEMIRRLSGEE
ncbi:LytR/AlgR family response regulator transcription factor [Paenibacillus xanthanilyticus]|uniref:LytR/AlgR family response regulator transcription factor n=1 Tax=Paenibacillus xanthanilyticus TaxID=1783531 RepID=A0ABV8JWW8_9BACL